MAPWTAMPWFWRTSTLRSFSCGCAPTKPLGSGISNAPGPGSNILSELFSSGRNSRICRESSRICTTTRPPAPIVMRRGIPVRASARISARAPPLSGIANGAVFSRRPCQSITAA